jgi:hypothetical protein
MLAQQDVAAAAGCDGIGEGDDGLAGLTVQTVARNVVAGHGLRSENARAEVPRVSGFFGRTVRRRQVR